jgi:hypothetical protein
MPQPDKPGRRERAIAALLAEPSVEAAARSARVGVATLRRWLAQPEFRAAYRAARRELLEGAVGQLQKAAGSAVDALVGTLGAEKDGDKIRAATAILDRAMRGLELLELVERVEEIERRLESRGGPARGMR